jgi:hypothetical protein
MKLELLQEERHYEAKDGSRYTLRVLQPSEPYGVWPGNDRVIRKWTACLNGSTSYEPASKKMIIVLERGLGETKNFGFLTHPTLGLVTFETMI